MDQDLAATVQRLVNEAIRDAEVLLDIFLWLVVDVQVKVLEVALTLSVGLACHIEDVGDAGLDQVACFKSGLERSNEDALVDLEETDVADRFLAVDVARTEVAVREAATDSLLLLTRILLTVIFLGSAELLFVEGWPTDPLLLLLQLRDRDGVLLRDASVLLLALAFDVPGLLLLNDCVGICLLVLTAIIGITCHLLVFVHCNYLACSVLFVISNRN